MLSRKTLREFWVKHPDAEAALAAWFKEAERAAWSKPADIKKQHATASFVGNDRVVFNIRGNRYRLVVSVKYAFKIVYVRFVGTHEEYDAIEVETV